MLEALDARTTAASRGTCWAAGSLPRDARRASAHRLRDDRRASRSSGRRRRGKSAVAEALARRIPAELDLGRLGAALPRAADPDEPVACGARRDLGARPRGVGRRVPGARARGDRRRARRRADAGRRRRHRPVLPCCARRARRSARRRSRARASAGSASTTSEGAEAAHALLAERDPEAAAAVHPNDRRRVVRALELAEAGHSLRGDRLWAAETRHPTLIVGLDVPTDELERRIEARTRAMFDAGVEDEVRQALTRPLSSTARKIMGLREVAELPRAEAEAALVRAHAAASPRTSGSGCAGSPASLPCGPTGLPTRWRMRFSRWRAAGNEYLLVERAELGGPLTPERVRAEVGELRRDPRGRLDRRRRGGDRDLEPRRLDRRDVRERDAHRRALARRAKRRRRGADPGRPAAR